MKSLNMATIASNTHLYFNSLIPLLVPVACIVSFEKELFHNAVEINFSGPNDVISIDHVLPTGTFCLAYAHIGILYVNEHDFLSPCLFEQLYFDCIC